MGPDVATKPVGRDELADLVQLFGGDRNTRHCWCMAFCTTRARFAAGWVTGGNRRRFEALAAVSPTPMGIVASVADEPVGWCACGPRSRYAQDRGPQRSLPPDRSLDEDETVWLLACLFVRDGFRGEGISHALVRGAIELARSAGARAIEGWPLTSSDRLAADAFLGRQRVFSDLGFRMVDELAPDRVLMRRELGRTGG